MNFLRRLFGRPEARAGAVSFQGGAYSLGNYAGTYTPQQAENLSTVTACVNVVASTLGSLPARVYRRDSSGRFETGTHPVARLIRQPNPQQTWPDFIEWLVASTLLSGNGLAAIMFDGAGKPTGLYPVPWQYVRPVLLPSGALAFDVVAYNSPWGATGLPRRLLASEVLHLKDRTDDGLIGRSRISLAPFAIGNATALQEFSTSMWENSSVPAGVLRSDKKLDQGTVESLRLAFEQKYSGTGNARRPMILTEGLQWQSLSVSPEDAEILESRKFTVEELCRLFQVPPPLVQDYSRNTFTNAATAGLWFAQFSLSPWVRKIEAEFSRSVFGPASAYDLEIDLSGLTRGDYAARWQSYAIAMQSGILDANEIREAEGWNPRAPAQPEPPPRSTEMPL